MRTGKIGNVRAKLTESKSNGSSTNDENGKNQLTKMTVNTNTEPCFRLPNLFNTSRTLTPVSKNIRARVISEIIREDPSRKLGLKSNLQIVPRQGKDGTHKERTQSAVDLANLGLRNRNCYARLAFGFFKLLSVLESLVF